MQWLIIGLVLFLGIHSARVFAEGARQRFIAQRGELAWKGVYSVVSLLGFVLMLKGYGQARLEPVVLWMPPTGMRHLAALLTLLSFILLAAAYVPRNAIKARLRHPMTLAIKVWAAAHLLANGSLADVLLFGGFLLWSVLVFRAARQRDRAAALAVGEGAGAGAGAGAAGADVAADAGAAAASPNQAPATSPAALAAVVLGGALAWAVFAFWAHQALIGVRPFGG